MRKCVTVCEVEVEVEVVRFQGWTSPAWDLVSRGPQWGLRILCFVLFLPFLFGTLELIVDVQL